jgi:hypothetical protein
LAGAGLSVCAGVVFFARIVAAAAASGALGESDKGGRVFLGGVHRKHDHLRPPAGRSCRCDPSAGCLFADARAGWWWVFASSSK